jgi:hypothetical protein
MYLVQVKVLPPMYNYLKKGFHLDHFMDNALPTYPMEHHVIFFGPTLFRPYKPYSAPTKYALHFFITSREHCSW